MPFRIEVERAEGGDAGGGLAVGADGLPDQLVAAEQGADAGDQLAHAEWFPEVVVGAQFQADDAVRFLATGGEHEHRGGGGLPDLAQDIEAAEPGQHPVEHDQVHALAGVQVERGAAIGGAEDMVAGGFQLPGNDLGQLASVFDQENAPWQIAHAGLSSVHPESRVSRCLVEPMRSLHNRSGPLLGGVASGTLTPAVRQTLAGSASINASGAHP